MQRILTLFGILFLLTAVSGCQTTSPSTGSGPITLSPSAANMFEEYKKEEYPLYFAVSTDGRVSAYGSCPIQQYACRDASAIGRIRSCEESGLKCKIFASWGNIIWDGPVTYPNNKEGIYPAMLSINFGQSSEISNGRATLDPDNGNLNIKVRAKGKLCKGAALAASKKWQLSCEGGDLYKGTFVDDLDHKIDGIGFGPDDVQVQLTVMKSGAAADPR